MASDASAHRPDLNITMLSSEGQKDSQENTDVSAETDVHLCTVLSRERSRRIIARKSKEMKSASDIKVIVMAGPMRQFDRLHLAMALLTLAVLALLSVSMFALSWFSVSSNVAAEKVYIGLYDHGSCKSYVERLWSQSETVCDSVDHKIEKVRDVLRFLAPMSLSLVLFSLVLQLINLFVLHRRLQLHNWSLFFMATSVLLMSVTGHVGHNKSVWRDIQPSSEKITSLMIEPLTSGLFLLSSVLATSVCVIAHVSRRGRGPLSSTSLYLNNLYGEESIFVPHPKLDSPVDIEMGGKVYILEKETQTMSEYKAV